MIDKYENWTLAKLKAEQNRLEKYHKDYLALGLKIRLKESYNEDLGIIGFKQLVYPFPSDRDLEIHPTS